ncbi:DUF4169 family protein [Sandaracinobacter neustonicus]|uniref:DUF4169 family protein n=1 Tax=Sandaracinobacter neustonicus TaxID=1715348 RepID=A0A501XJM8_9SPHN|nr:DUF4169 family protein [Sandaracinobacter neustonicus]TPE60503.1 DUF4169 family protein [Sandaracinobacter neustonicus]
MGDIINLRQARKARKRAEAERQAEANRLKHGRTKAEKLLTEKQQQAHDRTLDNARREHPED